MPMKPKAKRAKKGSKAAARKKLAAGAAQIRQAEKEAKGGAAKKNKKQKQQPPAQPAPPAPVEIPELTRSAEEIVKDRVQVLPGSIGLAIHEDTPLEETLAIYDYVNTMGQHVGFMMGDVINFGEARYGEKYSLAMQQTGRANSTLKGYAEVSRRIPPDKRIAALSFSHHREIIRLENAEKREALLEEVGKAAAEGKAPTTKDLRYKVQKMQPRKPKSKRVTSGKGKRGKGKVAEPYKPTDEEQSHIDAAEEVLEEARAAITDKPLQKVLLKVDNNTKKQWSKMLEPFRVLQIEIDKHTGY